MKQIIYTEQTTEITLNLKTQSSIKIYLIIQKLTIFN